VGYLLLLLVVVCVRKRVGDIWWRWCVVVRFVRLPTTFTVSLSTPRSCSAPAAHFNCSHRAVAKLLMSQPIPSSHHFLLFTHFLSSLQDPAAEEWGDGAWSGAGRGQA
jgi:hypothetical protein